MKRIGYYFKPTKQCNLRCLYCSEQENYRDLQSLSLAIMGKIFSKILFFHKYNKLKHDIRFFYSGGEILTLGKKWMRAIVGLQRDIFRTAKIKYSTVIQTNLTLLDPEWIELLKRNNVQIGTSLDLFAGTRPFKGRKRDSASTVVDKLIMLAENRLNAGVIIVITRHNHKRGKEIYKILNEIGLSFHTLPLEPDSIKYCPELGISSEEYAECLSDMAEEYLKPNSRIKVRSLDGYIDLVKRGYPSQEGMCTNSRNCWEGELRFFFENTGDTYFCGCFCKPEVLLGNVFNDSIGKMFSRVAAKGVFKKLIGRYKLIRKICEGCEFLSLCNGGCPSFAYQEGDMFSKSKFFCVVNKRLFSYFKNTLSRVPKHIERQNYTIGQLS